MVKILFSEEEISSGFFDKLYLKYSIALALIQNLISSFQQLNIA